MDKTKKHTLTIHEEYFITTMYMLGISKERCPECYKLPVPKLSNEEREKLIWQALMPSYRFNH